MEEILKQFKHLRDLSDNTDDNDGGTSKFEEALKKVVELMPRPPKRDPNEDKIVGKNRPRGLPPALVSDDDEALLGEFAFECPDTCFFEPSENC